MKTTPQHLETITKAKQTANLLNGDIRAAHRSACENNPLLEILLRELIADAVKMQNRLAEIEACFGSPHNARVRRVPAGPPQPETQMPDSPSTVENVPVGTSSVIAGWPSGKRPNNSPPFVLTQG